MEERKEATDEQKQYVREYCAKWKDEIWVVLEKMEPGQGGLWGGKLVQLSKLSPKQYHKYVEGLAFYGDIPITGDAYELD